MYIIKQNLGLGCPGDYTHILEPQSKVLINEQRFKWHNCLFEIK